MRKLIASFFISLDGVVEAPDKWHFPYFNDEMGAAVGEAIGASDSLLLAAAGAGVRVCTGRSRIPRSDPFVSIMNDTPKFVASTTLENVTTGRTRPLLEGDLRARLSTRSNAQPGKNIGMSGALRSCGRCSRPACSTSCGCSRATRSSSARARSCSGTALRLSTSSSPTRGRSRPASSTSRTGRVAEGAATVQSSRRTGRRRLRQRRQRAGADHRRRRVQLSPLKSWLQLVELLERVFASSTTTGADAATRVTRRIRVEREVGDLDALVRAAGGSAHVFGMVGRRARPCGRRGRRADRASGFYQPPVQRRRARGTCRRPTSNHCSRARALGQAGRDGQLLHARGMGAPRAFVALLRVARPIWKEPRGAVAQQLPTTTR